MEKANNQPFLRLQDAAEDCTNATPAPVRSVGGTVPRRMCIVAARADTKHGRGAGCNPTSARRATGGPCLL